MTPEQKLSLEIAIQYLKDIRNNVPNVNAIKLRDENYYMKMFWNNSMLALKALEKLTKTTT